MTVRIYRVPVKMQEFYILHFMESSQQACEVSIFRLVLQVVELNSRVKEPSRRVTGGKWACFEVSSSCLPNPGPSNHVRPSFQRSCALREEMLISNIRM